MVVEVLFEQVGQALKVVGKLAVLDAAQSNLLEDNSTKYIKLQVAVKKIPAQRAFITVKIRLPHSYKANQEGCLFVSNLNGNKDKDLAWHDTEAHYQAMIKATGVKCVKRIMPLLQLKQEFKSYEAKRKLSNAYDFFLTDKAIVKFLRSTLGKHFYERARKPVEVDCTTQSKLTKSLDSAICTTLFTMSGRGNSAEVVIGSAALSNTQLQENVCAAIEQLFEKLPGGRENVKSIVIRAGTSKSVPIHCDTSAAPENLLPASGTLPSWVTGKLTTVDGDISVSASGFVKAPQLEERRALYKKVQSAEDNVKRAKKKAKKGGGGEESADSDESDEEVEEKESKKRKQKGEGVEDSEVSEKRQVKKAKKARADQGVEAADDELAEKKLKIKSKKSVLPEATETAPAKLKKKIRSSSIDDESKIPKKKSMSSSRAATTASKHEKSAKVAVRDVQKTSKKNRT